MSEDNKWMTRARHDIEDFETLLSPEDEKRLIRILTTTVCNAYLDGVEKGKTLKIEQIKDALRL